MATPPINYYDLASVNFKNPFIMKLQLDYQHREMLQLRNPIYFRYAIRLLGDFIYKARLSSGRPISLLTISLYIYLKMLLKSGQEEDLELFTIQLFQNGIGICTYFPHQFTELQIEVHAQLHFNDKLSKTSKLWLQLAMDIVKNKFELPPYDLQKYYLNNLGQPIFEQFYRVQMESTIKIFHNMKILKYTSEANNLDHTLSNSSQPSANCNKYLAEASPEANNLGHVPFNSWQPRADRNKYLAEASPEANNLGHVPFNSWQPRADRNKYLAEASPEANNLGHVPFNSWQPRADRNKYLAEASRTQSQAASNNYANVSTTNTKPRNNIYPTALRPILGRDDSRKMKTKRNAKSEDLVVDLDERGRE